MAKAAAPSLLATVLFCLAVPLQAQDDARDLLWRVRQSVLQTVEGMPRYVCTLTIDRARYQPDSSRFVPDNGKHHVHSCDSLAAEVNGPGWKRQLTSSDRLRLDVAVTHSRPGVDSEMYSWAGADRFSNEDLFQLVHDGAMSTGSFSSMLASIFGGEAANFSYNGDRTTIGGRLLAEFGFRVPLDKSRYSYVVGANQARQVAIEYGGTILADPATSDLVRLVVRASHLPEESSSCEITQSLDYRRITLNGGEFFLPSEARIISLHTDGTQAENVIHYSACHEFRGDSTVQYRREPDTGTTKAADTASTPDLALPAGLPFRLVFTERIDTSEAAAGDPIQAKLKTPIRDRNHILVPEGAVVKMRIVNVRHFYGPLRVPGSDGGAQRASLTMKVKLESVQFGGRSYPIKARSDSGVSQFVQIPGTMARRVEVGGADRLENSDEGVFDFFDPNPNRIVTSGLESSWLTAK